MIINDNNDVNLRPYYRFSLLIDNKDQVREQYYFLPLLTRYIICSLMYTTHEFEKHSGVSEEKQGCNDGRVYRREAGELPADEAPWARGLRRCVPGRTHLSPDGRGH